MLKNACHFLLSRLDKAACRLDHRYLCSNPCDCIGHIQQCTEQIFLFRHLKKWHVPRHFLQNAATYIFSFLAKKLKLSIVSQELLELSIAIISLRFADLGRLIIEFHWMFEQQSLNKQRMESKEVLFENKFGTFPATFSSFIYWLGCFYSIHPFDDMMTWWQWAETLKTSQWCL